MALDFGGKQKTEDKFREELRVLGTQIETINQQLAEGGSSIGGGPATVKQFSDINTKLQYLYELLKNFQSEVKEDVKESLAEVKKSVNQTLSKNLGDLYASQKESQQAVDGLQKQLAKSPAFNAGEFGNMRDTLKTLVDIYKEEVGIFRKQNEFLQQKLVAIERQLAKKET